MAPARVVQEDAAGEQQGTVSSSRLDDLPVETLIEILCYLDFESFDNMLLVSRRLNSIIEAHWPSLLREIIEREFSPVQDFFDTLWDVDLPRPLTCSQLLTVCHSADGFQPLLNLCRVIKRWEAEFPSMRFANSPQHSRIMSPDELYRLRRGLYIWWRYARAFHGPAVCLDNNPEVRRSFVRQFSTTELHEVFDMWQTISSAVGREICPSVILVQGLQGKWATKEENARIGWGGLTENTDIVRTMMKLQPDDLLHLLVYRHRYATKASVIRFVRLRYPGIEDSVESFREAIIDVMIERRVTPFRPFPQPGFPEACGGILDHGDAEGEALRAVHSADGGSGIQDYPQWWRDADAARVVRAGRLDPAL